MVVSSDPHLRGVEDHPGGVADEEEDDDDDEHLGYPLVSPLSVGGGPDIRMEDRDFYFEEMKNTLFHNCNGSHPNCFKFILQ